MYFGKEVLYMEVVNVFRTEDAYRKKEVNIVWIQLINTLLNNCK